MCCLDDVADHDADDDDDDDVGGNGAMGACAFVAGQSDDGGGISLPSLALLRSSQQRQPRAHQLACPRPCLPRGHNDAGGPAVAHDDVIIS